MYSFVCPDCRVGEHEKCPGGTWCDCLHRPRKDSHPYGRNHMLKRFGAGVAVLAVTALTLLAAPAAAQAATNVAPVVTTTPQTDEDCLQPQKLEVTPLSFSRVRIELPCRQITFTDNCDETVTVLVENTASTDSPFKVRFRIERDGPDWFSSPLGGGESDTVILSATENQNIQVESRYPAGSGPYLNFGDEHDWAWNASCLEVTSVSNCDNTFKVSVKNISTEDGTFKWQLGLGASTETDILAGATLSQTFNKGDVVNVRHGVSNELVKTLEFKQPVCTTPTPSTPPTTAPPVGRDTSNDLPATGAQGASTDLRYATIALGVALTAGAGLGVLWFVRRQRRQTSPLS